MAGVLDILISLGCILWEDVKNMSPGLLLLAIITTIVGGLAFVSGSSLAIALVRTSCAHVCEIQQLKLMISNSYFLHYISSHLHHASPILPRKHTSQLQQTARSANRCPYAAGTTNGSVIGRRTRRPATLQIKILATLKTPRFS